VFCFAVNTHESKTDRKVRHSSKASSQTPTGPVQGGFAGVRAAAASISASARHCCFDGAADELDDELAELDEELDELDDSTSASAMHCCFDGAADELDDELDELDDELDELDDEELDELDGSCRSRESQNGHASLFFHTQLTASKPSWPIS